MRLFKRTTDWVGGRYLSIPPATRRALAVWLGGVAGFVCLLGVTWLIFDESIAKVGSHSFHGAELLRLRTLVVGLELVIGVFAVLMSASNRVGRSIGVILGLGLYIGLQLGLAFLVYFEGKPGYMFSGGYYQFIAGFFILAITIALAAGKPTLAFLVWLFSSPLGFIFLRLDFGEGLPAITYDRVAIIFLASLLLARTLVDRNPPRKLITGEWLMLAFIGYSTLALFWAQHESYLSLAASISEKFDHIGLAVIIYFVAKASLRKKEHIVLALFVIVLIGAYTGLSGIYEHFTGNRWFSSFMGSEYALGYGDVERGRATGPLLNPSAYGTFLGIAIFAAFHLLAHTRSKMSKFLYLVTIAGMVIACYYSFTRGGYLALAAFILLMPFFAKGTRRQYMTVLLVTVVLAVTVVPIVLSNAGVRSRLTKLSTIYTRVAITASTINIIRHHPWFGVGLGNIDQALEVYITNAGDLSGMHARGYFPDQRRRLRVITSHNSILTVFAEQGILGGGLYSLAMFAFFMHLIRLRGRLADKGILGKDFITFVLVAIIGHTASITTYDIRFFKFPSYVFWILLALAIRLEELGTAEPAPVLVEREKEGVEPVGELVRV